MSIKSTLFKSYYEKHECNSIVAEDAVELDLLIKMESSSMDAMKNPLEDFSFADPFSTWWPFIIAILVGVVTTIR